MPPKEITAQQMVSRLLYRDGLMLVIDKPAGIAVHRGPKGGESLEDHFDALRFGLPRRPALAHRLDRDTSGCLVLGRHRKALAQLGKLFKSGAIGKTYWAVVESGPHGDAGQIELPLGRLDVSRGWWMKHDPAGQPAVTKWTVMGRSVALRNIVTSSSSASSSAAHQLTWLALEPLTGRTHQIRVHCAAMGWPIRGDAIYGTASHQDRPKYGPKDAPIQHLHAREVVVPLYKNRAPIRVVAPIPAHMRAALAQCGWRDEQAPETLLPRATGTEQLNTKSP
jgi:tRNA pseudouridine32 synthase/23S rRNA pseudouridine746 synthase